MPGQNLLTLMLVFTACVAAASVSRPDLHALLPRQNWDEPRQCTRPTTCSEDISIVCETSGGSPKKNDCQTIVDKSCYTQSGCGYKYGKGCNTDGAYNTCKSDICQDGRSDLKTTCLPEMQRVCERLYQSYLIGNCTQHIDGEERVGVYLTVNDADGDGRYLNFQFSSRGDDDETGCAPLDLCQAIGK